jgi:pyroglutamyl-peptidase
MPPTLLLAGFEPFGKSTRNPSQELVLRLADMGLPGAHLQTLVLPVDTHAAPTLLVRRIDELCPAALLLLGEAGRRSRLSIERLGVNLLDFRIADNAGTQPSDQPIVPGGPAAYFATLPLRAMLEASQQAGVPAELSLSAGAFLCNQVLYAALHHAAVAALPTRAGFVHLPPLPEQVAAGDRSGPSLALETSLRGVRAMAAAIAAALHTG